MCRLIVESGATKTDWLCGDMHVRTKGINLAVMSDNDIRTVVEDAVDALTGAGQAGDVEELFFYGAGIVSEKSSERLRAVFSEYFPDAAMEFASDLMAAARALWADRPGVVAILGSGSNSGSYDGKRIVKNVKPGGYILGDEGGGVSVGRRFIADFIKDLLPPSLRDEFAEEYRLDYEKVVDAVYKGRNPSGFLASFAPFVVQRAERNEYARKIVTDNFRNFIERALLAYRRPGEDMEAGVTGAFGCSCRPLLEALGREYGIYFVKFIDSPIKVLSGYHENYNFAPPKIGEI